MDTLILLPGEPVARSGLTLHTTPETSRAGNGRRTLRMTGIVDRPREAAGT